MTDQLELLKKYRIGVLAGGPSSEREISLKSGKAVFDILRKSGLDVSFIDVEEQGFDASLEEAGISLAFIALHGRFGEDGTVQALLAKRKIPYTGSGPESSALALDKLASKEVFEKEGIFVPRYRVVSKDQDTADISFTFPCVVKPRHEGSSVGLSIVSSGDQLSEAVRCAFEFDDEIMVEEYNPGREITVGILGDASLPVIEIVAENNIYDYNAKYTSSETEYKVPAGLDEDVYLRVQEAGLKAHRSLGCRGFSRVDMRLAGDGKVFVLEVNTIPGLTERSLLPMAAKAEG
ncbi:MAG: D-alanine--D-alanine ligase, partial [Candidatus Omnitrophica bacterium]|nr:D-alanine--D-alanine ligase [Candidatus Omnitrophota bacterium]